MEALLLGLLVAVNFVAMVALRSIDPSVLGLSGEALEQVQAQLNAYWSIPWYLPLLGGLERVSAITIQIALSLLVLRAFTRQNLGWLFVAIGAHAVVDGVAVSLAGLGWSALALEGVVLIFALGGLALILTFRPSRGISESGC